LKRRAAFGIVPAVASAVLTMSATADPQVQPSPHPFADARSRVVGYEGPGREDPTPRDLTEVRLGYFGPSDPSHPEGGDFWRGASLALDETNAEGGYDGLPFRLVAGWSDSPWRAGVVRVTDMVFQDHVWAVIGSIDGTTSHLAEQVVAKAFVTLVSPGSTDKTVNMANVPWMFSALPSDAAQAPAVGRALLAASGGDFVLVSGTDHDSRAAAKEFGEWLSLRSKGPRIQAELAGDDSEASAAIRVIEARPAAVLVVAGAGPAGRLVKALRASGYRGQVLGGATLGRDEFRNIGGAAIEGVVFPLLYEPGAGWDAFAARFTRRFGLPPDYAAGQAYDSVRLLAAAVREAGLNRARIRDAVRGLSPWHGVAGVIDWDPLGQNQRPVRLGRIQGGLVVPMGLEP
jgi:branched-chain amino acid transport system substrate-binding protein